MRVLQLGPFPPPWGGVQTNVVSIRDYLRRHGAEASVINITGNRKPDGDGVHYPASAAALLRLLYTLRYDVVHIHVGGHLPPRVLSLMLACATVPGRRSVFTFHSGGFPSSPAGEAARARSFLGIVLRRFDAVIGVNPRLVEFFRRMGVPAARTHLVYPHAFGPETAAIAARGRGGLPEPLRGFYAAHDPVLATVGLLEPEYDLPLQIAALGRVRERHPRAGLVIAGSGSREAELRAQIAAAPWGEHVLLAGDVPREHTLLAIATADAVLRTTLYDGDAISVREALHLGTPVIASDNGMRPTGVRLVPKQDAGALVAAVDRAVADARRPERRVADGGEENLAAVVRLYERLTGERVLDRAASGAPAARHAHAMTAG
jgi:glycosyltransferase involved in cell wall biosynthesis